MKVAFYTLGCKVNQYETDLMMKSFTDHGYDIVDFEEKADIYVGQLHEISEGLRGKT